MIFLGKYLWDSFFIPEKSIIPVDYINALKDRKVPPEVEKAILHHPDKARCFFIWQQMRWLAKKKIEGAIAELGVYKGESSFLLKVMAPERDLYLFDTWEGFPETDLRLETGEAATYTAKNFSDVDFEAVKDLFSDYDNVHFIKGYFPESLKDFNPDIRFAFVSLDADLYNPTISGLRYFYPRLNKGGIIIIHDYNHKWEGLMKAVDEFLEEVDETPIAIPDKDGSIVIVKCH